MSELTNMNNLREETIKINYQAALMELQDLTKANPLATTFTIYAGCTTAEMTEELTARLVAGGLNAEAKTKQWFGAYNIRVMAELPETLIHKVVEEVVASSTEEVKTEGEEPKKD
jgi:hypothetical protein